MIPMPRRTRFVPAPLPGPILPSLTMRELRDFFCDGECQGVTEFRLNSDGDKYECRECGWAMDYHINNAPAMYAILF